MKKGKTFGATGMTIRPLRIETPFLIRPVPVNTFSRAAADQIMEDFVVLKSAWPPYQQSSPIDWDTDPFSSRSWRLYYHALTTVTYLLDAHQRTSDLSYLIKARLIAESWLLAKGKPRRSKSDYAWNEHSVASRTLTLIALHVFWQHSILVDQEFETALIKAIRSHGRWLADPAEYRQSNHGFLQDRALLSVAVFYPQFKDAATWRETALTRLGERCRADVSPSGVHLEHSPFYHVFFMRLVASVRDFLVAHKCSEGEDYSQLLERMEHYVVHIARNDCTLPFIGDSRLLRLDAEFRRQPIGDHLRFVLSGGDEGRQPTETDVAYPDAGVAVMRDRWCGELPVQLVFVAGFHSLTHKHADDCSFVLRVGDTDVLIDAGSLNSEINDPVTTAQRRVWGHNTIAVDDESYPIVADQIGRSRLDPLMCDDDGVRVQGSHQHYSGVTITRTIRYRKPEVIEIRDAIESDAEHDYTLIFNVGETMSIYPVTDGFVLRDRAAGIEVDLLVHGQADEVRRFRGEPDAALGWGSRVYGVAYPFETIHIIRRGTSVTFETTLSIRRLQ